MMKSQRLWKRYPINKNNCICSIHFISYCHNLTNVSRNKYLCLYINVSAFYVCSLGMWVQFVVCAIYFLITTNVKPSCYGTHEKRFLGIHESFVAIIASSTHHSLAFVYKLCSELASFSSSSVLVVPSDNGLDSNWDWHGTSVAQKHGVSQHS